MLLTLRWLDPNIITNFNEGNKQDDGTILRLTKVKEIVSDRTLLVGRDTKTKVKQGGDSIDVSMMAHMEKMIQAVFTKLLDSVQAETYGVKILEKIVAELLNTKSTSLQETIFAHSDNLSLFLSLRHTYLSSKYKD